MSTTRPITQFEGSRRAASPRARLEDTRAVRVADGAGRLQLRHRTVGAGCVCGMHPRQRLPGRQPRAQRLHATQADAGVDAGGGEAGDADEEGDV